jgi:hypothetical protein
MPLTYSHRKGMEKTGWKEKIGRTSTKERDPATVAVSVAAIMSGHP